MRTLPSSRHQAIEVFRNNASMPEGRIPQIAAGAARARSDRGAAFAALVTDPLSTL
jgi:hypothetical protein